jgi:transcriptional regulator with XRE-family HTH domain
MPEQLAASLGKAVRVARQQAQMTREQVAHAIELSPLAYARLERGLLIPSVEKLVRLSQLLHTPTDVLLGDVLSQLPQPPSNL